MTWVGGGSGGERAFAAVATKTLHLEFLGDDLAELGRRLQGTLSGGGCAAVICNTVARAQEVYQALGSWFGPDELDLFHARYPFGERELREQRALARYGKASESNGQSAGVRPRSVLVATQVIEQSLDLDFDLMVTDLAPVDLVLQRAGRLQRHSRVRPTGLEQPLLWIVVPKTGTTGVPAWKGSGRIYSPHVLLRSWLTLRTIHQIVIPDDLERLIEAAYDERDCPAEVGESIALEWKESLAKQASLESERSLKASNGLIGGTQMDVLSNWCDSALEEEDDRVHPALRAVTRDGGPSVTVAMFYETAEGLSESPDGKAVQILEHLDEAQVELILRRSVSLPRSAVTVAPGKQEEIPKCWKRQSHLRTTRLVRLSADTGAAFDYSLRLDRELGVVFTKGKEHD